MAVSDGGWRTSHSQTQKNGCHRGARFRLRLHQLKFLQAMMI